MLVKGQFVTYVFALHAPVRSSVFKHVITSPPISGFWVVGAFGSYSCVWCSHVGGQQCFNGRPVCICLPPQNDNERRSDNTTLIIRSVFVPVCPRAPVCIYAHECDHCKVLWLLSLVCVSVRVCLGGSGPAPVCQPRRIAPAAAMQALSSLSDLQLLDKIAAEVKELRRRLQVWNAG